MVNKDEYISNSICDFCRGMMHKSVQNQKKILFGVWGPAVI